MDPTFAAGVFHTTSRLLSRDRANVARRIRNLVRKIADRISHVRHLLFQAGKSTVVACVSRFVASLSVGRNVGRPSVLRNTR